MHSPSASSVEPQLSVPNLDRFKQAAGFVRPAWRPDVRLMVDQSHVEAVACGLGLNTDAVTVGEFSLS